MASKPAKVYCRILNVGFELIIKKKHGNHTITNKDYIFILKNNHESETYKMYQKTFPVLYLRLIYMPGILQYIYTE